MLNLLDKIIPKIKKIVLAALVAIGSAMLIVSWAHVFYRYVLNNSLSWSEELLKILLVWFCMLSVSYIAVDRGHVSIVIFKEKMPKAVNKFLTLLAQVLIFLASIYVIYIGFGMVNLAGSRMAPATQIPYALIYAALPIPFIIITFYEFRNLVYDIVHYNKESADI